MNQVKQMGAAAEDHAMYQLRTRNSGTCWVIG